MKKPINKLLLFFLIVYSILTGLYIFEVISYDILYSGIIAGILNLINTLIAGFLFEYSVGKGNNIFLIANLGGMGARMVLMLVAILLVIQFLKIHEIGFLLIFFVIYFILLSSEVLYFHKKTKNKNI